MDFAAIHQRLSAQFGERITAFQADALQPWAVVAPEAIADVAAFCKSDPELSFDNLMCLSAVDYPKETPPRLELVYHLYSYAHTHGFVLKVHLPRESPSVRTVENVWGVANWHEREAYDMFGIVFEGNRDLRRIYMPPDYTSFPLRKDFYLPDDAARSPGGGVRHVEAPHAPIAATDSVVRRTVKA